MQHLLRLDRFPNQSLEGGVERVNRLYLNITWREHAGLWWVYSGESLIYTSDSREATEAFLYGIGYTYVQFPEPVFERLEYEMKRLSKPETVTPEERARFEGRGEST